MNEIETRRRVPTPLLLIALLFAAAPVAAEDESKSEQPRLTVRVSNIQNDKGQVGCSVFSKADGFPNEADEADRSTFVKPKDGAATCVFEGLASGKYAVSVMHDENNDGKLETSIVGRPKEWWGVSNNVPAERFGPPKYQAAVFSFTGDGKTIKVKLRL